MPAGKAQEGRNEPGRGPRSWLLLDIEKGMSHHTIFYPAREECQTEFWKKSSHLVTIYILMLFLYGI